MSNNDKNVNQPDLEAILNRVFGKWVKKFLLIYGAFWFFFIIVILLLYWLVFTR